jgi:hypothetical protein
MVIPVASPAPIPAPAGSPVPATEPAALRISLPPTLRAIFEQEWALIMDEAKERMTLSGVVDLVQKWQHIAGDEARDPGAYFRVLAKAEQIQATGANPSAATFEDMQALIARRRQAS